MCCTEAITRILVFVANFAFLLVGGALLTLGIFYTVNFTKYTDAIPDQYQAIGYIPTLTIVVGSIIFVIAFLGCCGTLKSNTCMLTSYASILIVIFLAQVGLGVFAMVTIKDNQELQSKVNATMEQLFAKYSNNETAAVIDLIQQNFNCCGTTGPEYWNGNPPASCTSDNTLHTRGCSTLLGEFFERSIRVIALVAIIVSVTEIVGAILALCLSNCIRSNERKGAYY